MGSLSIYSPNTVSIVLTKTYFHLCFFKDNKQDANNMKFAILCGYFDRIPRYGTILLNNSRLTDFLTRENTLFHTVLKFTLSTTIIKAIYYIHKRYFIQRNYLYNKVTGKLNSIY